MLVIPTPESIYRGNYASLPANTLKPPVESNRTVPIEINWLNNGLPPQYTIHFNARQQQTLPISQIASLHIDNSNASSSMHVAFPDTQFEVIVGPNTVGFYPVVTNSLEFWCWIDKTPLAQDKTVIQVLNFLPPPIFFTTQPGGTGVGTVREVDTVAPLQGGPITDIGTVSLATPLALNFGGTGSTTAGGALDNLSGASGATAGTLVRAAGTPGVWSVAAGLSSPITVPNGGTGRTSLTGNAVLVGNGTGVVTSSAITSDNGTTLSVSTNMVIGRATPGAPAGGLTIDQASSAPLVGAPAGTPLWIIGDAGNEAQIFADAYATTPGVVMRQARGTAAAPTATQAADFIGVLAAEGRGATGYGGANCQIAMLALENWTDTAQGAELQFSTTPAGTVTQTIRMQLRQGLIVATNPQTTPDPGPGALVLNANTVNAPPGLGPTNLHIIGADGVSPVSVIDGFGNATPYYYARRARGTAAAPTAVQLNDVFLNVSAVGYGASAFGTSPAGMEIMASENWSGTANGTQIVFQTIPNTTNAPVNSLILQGNVATFSGNAIVNNAVAIGAPGSVGSAQRLTVFNTPTAGQVAMTVATGPAGADTTSYLMVFDDASGTPAFLGGIARNGTGTVAYQTTSDARLKTDIAESAIGLDALLQLKVYDFAWRSTGEAGHGFVAQEVQGIYPYAVREGGDDPASEPWTIDHGRLTPLLVRAVQQLKAELDELKVKLGEAA